MNCRTGKAARPASSFADRLGAVIAEFGSRYALARASGLPESTLQSYVLGTKPGIDALVKLSRAANLDLNWLLTGSGQMRPAGMMSGTAWVDILMVDQHDFRSSLNLSAIIRQIPFSRDYLEKTLHLNAPTPQTLLVVEAPNDLLDLARGDLVLIDRSQADISCDGIYLLNLPGFALRGLSRRPSGKVGVTEVQIRDSVRNGDRQHVTPVVEMEVNELIGTKRGNSKVVGRAVWYGHVI